VLGQHGRDHPNDFGICAVVAPTQLLGRSRDPLQKSTIGGGSGPGVALGGLHLARGVYREGRSRNS
jgi:hypothetical protein